MKFLPILIPCGEPDREGTVNGRPVKVVPYDVVDLLIKNRSKFHTKHGYTHEAKQLRGFWQIMDAVRGGKTQKLRDVACGLAELEEKAELKDSILEDPALFVQKGLSEWAAGASLVLWRARSRAALNAGIFCKGGMLDALAVLMLFRIGVGGSGGAGSCVICGTSFERERGDRKRTCSDKCRKRASRMKSRPAAPTNAS
jgi:hypothetical protein